MEDEVGFTLSHSGYVNWISLDNYGRRMASCSEDGVIKISSRTTSKENCWEEVCELRNSKSGAGILMACWSHPVHSSLLASISRDGRLCIWEEEQVNMWNCVELQTFDSSSLPLCIEFVPRHQNTPCTLAVGLKNGQVVAFSLQNDFITWGRIPRLIFSLPGHVAVTCISWNTFENDFPSLVCGSASGNSAVVYVSSSTTGLYFPISMGVMKHDGAVNQVAWAPNLGINNFHLIATASSDGTCKLWKLSLLNKTAPSTISLFQVLDHRSLKPSSVVQVYQVDWNTVGSMLSTSSDDGVCRIWAPNAQGEWALQTEM